MLVDPVGAPAEGRHDTQGENDLLLDDPVHRSLLTQLLLKRNQGPSINDVTLERGEGGCQNVTNSTDRLLECVTKGGRGSKMAKILRDVIFGWPLTVENQVLLHAHALYCSSLLQYNFVKA